MRGRGRTRRGKRRWRRWGWWRRGARRGRGARGCGGSGGGTSLAASSSLWSLLASEVMSSNVWPTLSRLLEMEVQSRSAGRKRKKNGG